MTITLDKPKKLLKQLKTIQIELCLAGVKGVSFGLGYDKLKELVKHLELAIDIMETAE